LGQHVIETGHDIAPGALVIHIGEMRFTAPETGVLVLALAAASLAALNLWRIGQSEDRQKRFFAALGRAGWHWPQPPAAPRLPWHQRLGALVAATRIIGKAEQERLLTALLAAGRNGHGQLAALLAAKLCSALLFAPFCWLVLEWRQFFVGATTLRLVFIAGAVFLGWRCPEVVLSRLAARRRLRLETGMPDALDLLVICAEAGLSLDHAIEQVGRVLRSSSPEVAEEFTATAAEMRVSAARGEALENLAQRSGVASLRGVAAALNQSIRFGTPLAQSVRVLAHEMRAERAVRFEERAARLPVILTLPLMAFILPALLLVIGTPLALRIIDMLGRGL
jgi:tight adherence protein C